MPAVECVINFWQRNRSKPTFMRLQCAVRETLRHAGSPGSQTIQMNGTDVEPESVSRPRSPLPPYENRTGTASDALIRAAVAAARKEEEGVATR